MRVCQKTVVSLCLLLGSLFSFQGKAQVLYGTNQINQHLRGYYAGLSKPATHPNYLYDMAAHEVDSLYYTYQHTDTLDYQTFLKMLVESKSMAYDTTLVANADTLYKYANRFGEDTIQLGIIDFNFYRLKPAALSTNIYFDFDTVNDILSDKAGRPGYPYDGSNTCVLAPLSPANYSSKVVYRIDPAFILADPSNVHLYDGAWANSVLKIDFADGNGWQTIVTSSVSYYTAQYTSSTGGNVLLQWDLVNTTKGTRNSHKFGNAIFTTGTEDYPEPDQHLQLPGLNIGVYNGCSNIDDPADKKVLIYLEGFDPLDAYPTLGRSIKSIYETQVRETGIDDLRRYGYDIYVISWQNSRLDIKLNAQFVEGLINYLKCNHPSKQPYVIMAESMGGLVARYALLEMEGGKKTDCHYEWGHNTRLLITIDSPHKGANVPMSVQFLYQDVVQNLFPMLAPDQRAALTITNQGLDGDAAKQMLYYHANMCLNTAAPQPAIPHPYHAQLLSDLQHLGNYPVLCKTIALSNGAMDGLGQTNSYNGGIRSPNDDLLALNSTSYINLLGLKLPIFNANITMRTNPSGAALVYNVNAGTFGIKLKLKWWGIKVTVGYNSLINNNSRTISNGDGICVQAGGVYSLPQINTDKVLGGMEKFSNFFFPAYTTVTNNNNGSYSIHGQWTKSGWFGNNTTVGSQGFHWDFVPTISALDYNTTHLNYNVEGAGLAIPANTPFSAVLGIHHGCDEWGTHVDHTVTTDLPYLYNRYHLTQRNDFITDNGSTFNGLITSPSALRYQSDDCGPGPYIQLLNREIGDDSLWLNNAKLKYSTRYLPEVSIFADVQSPYFKYSGSGVQARPGAYTKTNHFSILSGGYANLNYDSGKSGVYATGGLSTSQYHATDYSWVVCCDGDHKPWAPVQESKAESDNSLLAYPNPSHGENITIAVRSQAGGTLLITDVLGHTLYSRTLPSGPQSVLVDSKNIGLAPGVYIVSMKLPQKTLTAKLIINP